MAEFCDLSCGRCTPDGTGGTSGSGGASGSSGGSGGSGSSECGVDPVNPNATPQAKNLLCYLYSQYGNHVISGQQEMSWDNPAGDPAWINTQTGKYPAILGGDYLYPDGTTDRAKAWWNAGGITMIRYHMGLPGTPDTYENSKANIPGDKAQFFAQVLQSGTSLNTSFVSKLDYAAAELEELQNANVAVLWAPFHEVQPDGWFWWSKGTGAQFISLWQYMYDYFTNTKGLNNLVWLMPFSGTPTAAFHPPTQYSDIAGPDTYELNEPFTSMFTATKNIVGTTRPIPLHETGTMPSPSAMFNGNAAPWVLFNTWCGYQSDASKNSVQHVKDVYADAHTVTRDELPNLK
jgi:hypothetical protein